MMSGVVEEEICDLTVQSSSEISEDEENYDLSVESPSETSEDEENYDLSVQSPSEMLRKAAECKKEHRKYIFLRSFDIINFKPCKSWPFQHVQTIGIFREDSGRTRFFSLRKDTRYVHVKFHTESLPDDDCVAHIYGTFHSYEKDHEDVDELIFNVHIWVKIESVHKALEIERLLHEINTRHVD